MEVEDVRKWLEDLLRNLMEYDPSVLIEAYYHLASAGAYMYTLYIPLAIKYKDMENLRKNYNILFASRLLERVFTYKALKKEVPKDEIELLVNLFTYVYSPDEYRVGMIEVNSEIENALKVATEHIAWRRKLKE